MGVVFKCLKLLVTLFNFLIMVLGLLLSGFFLWVFVNVAVVSKVDSVVLYFIYFFMILGSLMFLLGFMGCCGALKESQCMLGGFFAVILLIFGGQVAAFTWAYSNVDVIEDEFGNGLLNLIRNHGDDEIVKEGLDFIQYEGKCCGSFGPKDWLPHSAVSLIVDIAKDKSLLPRSCCQSYPHTECEFSDFVSSAFFAEGCTTKLFNAIKENPLTVLVPVISISVVEVLSMIFSLILCLTFRRADYYKT